MPSSPRAAAPGSASEDYSEFIMAGLPSFYFGIGGLDPKAVAQAAPTQTPLPGNHSPEFAPVPEPTIRTGTAAMSLVLLDGLQKKWTRRSPWGRRRLPIRPLL